MTDIRDFHSILESPQSRTRRYGEMLPAFYAIATGPYRRNWSDSFHLPPFAPGEDLLQAVTRQEQRLARVAGLKSGSRALDLGCGIGGPALSIADYSGAHVTGINIVPAHVETARERAQGRGLQHLTDFLVGDMMTLPFRDETFDVVFSFDAICHTPRKETVYREAARVLRPGGVFVGADWLCRDGLDRDEYQKWIEPVCAAAALPSILSLREAVTGIEQAGFRVDDYCDLAVRGDMTPNWEIFERAAATIPDGRSESEELMLQHCLTTARAGRAGAFVIGYWCAHKQA